MTTPEPAQKVASEPPGLDILLAWRALLANVEVEDGLNRTAVRGRAQPSDLHVDDAISFVQRGGQLRLRFVKSGWGATAQAAGRNWSLEHTGPIDDAFPDPREAAEVRDAIGRGDAHAFLLRTLPNLEADLVGSAVTPAGTAFAWVRTMAALAAELLDSRSWLSAIRTIQKAGKVYVSDMGDVRVSTAAGAVICGPDAHGDASPPVLKREPRLAAYLDQWHPSASDAIPAPHELLIREAPAGFPDDAFNACAALSAWLWLVEAHRVTPSGVEVQMNSADLRWSAARPQDAQAIDDVIALWEWATASNDALRREALGEAVAAVAPAGKIPWTAAASIKQRARYLLRLARQAPLAEMLGAVRQVRLSAVTSAREATRRAAESAATAGGRTAASITAAAALLATNARGLLNEPLATTLGVLAAVALAVASAIALLELKSAKQQLGYELDELKLVGDILPAEDVEAIRSGSAVRYAYSRVDAARKLTWVLTVLAVLVLTFVPACLASVVGSPGAEAPEAGSSSESEPPGP